MANKVKQYYGIKFPFTDNNYDGHFIDLNNKFEDKIASEIAHVILTRKGTRLRMPEFGTDLIRYVFGMNDKLEWDNVDAEIKKAVSTYVPAAKITEINVVRSEKDDRKVYVDVNYTVTKGASEESYRMALTL